MQTTGRNRCTGEALCRRRVAEIGIGCQTLPTLRILSELQILPIRETKPLDFDWNGIDAIGTRAGLECDCVESICSIA